MPILDVGDLFDPEHTHYDFEGTQLRIGGEPLSEMMTLTDVDNDGNPLPYDVLQSYVHLVQFWRNPSPEEIDLHDNPGVAMQFALTPGQHAMMVSYRFESHDWSEAPFQTARASELPALPDPQGQSHLPIWVMVIDSGTGILRARRLVSWPPEFGGAVRDALAAQERAGEGMSREARVAAGQAEVMAWMQKYPTPAALVDAEAQIIVRAGKQHEVIRNRQ